MGVRKGRKPTRPDGYHRKRYASDPEYRARCNRSATSSSLMRRYGITPEEYEAMLKGQGNVCATCGTNPDDRRLAVDHDHATGKVRGLLCIRCNRAIGLALDNPKTLRNMASYLEQADGRQV